MRYSAARKNNGVRRAPASAGEYGDFFCGHRGHGRRRNVSGGSVPESNRSMFARCRKIISAAASDTPKDTTWGGVKCGSYNRYTSGGSAAAAAIDPSETYRQNPTTATKTIT